MSKKITIGRYIETHSIIHKLNSSIKLIWMILFIAILMTSNTWHEYLILTLVVLILITLTKIPLLIFLKGIKPLLKIIIFTAVLQLFFTTTGPILLEFSFVTITINGVRNAFIIFIRFSLVLMLTSVVGLSTKPMDLTTGVELLLSPLKLIGVKIQELALILAISLRFIPTLQDEGMRLKLAQESRGIQFDEGNFIEKIKKVIPLILPIFIGSFYRAHEMANALDVRGYTSEKNRTKYKKFSFSYKDLLFISTIVLIMFIFLLF